jgi:hypothetical protein
MAPPGKEKSALSKAYLLVYNGGLALAWCAPGTGGAAPPAVLPLGRRVSRVPPGRGPRPARARKPLSRQPC